MFTQNISFKNFLIKKKKLVVKKNLNLILNEKNQVISSLSKSYKDSFNKKNTKYFNKKFDYRIQYKKTKKIKMKFQLLSLEKNVDHLQKSGSKFTKDNLND